MFSVDAGGWGEWSAWSYCSATCGRGKMERSRQCDAPEPVGGGRPCVGLLTQQKDCSLRDCPGSWNNSLIMIQAEKSQNMELFMAKNELHINLKSVILSFFI